MAHPHQGLRERAVNKEMRLFRARLFAQLRGNERGEIDRGQELRGHSRGPGEHRNKRKTKGPNRDQARQNEADHAHCHEGIEGVVERAPREAIVSDRAHGRASHRPVPWASSNDFLTSLRGRQAHLQRGRAERSRAAAEDHAARLVQRATRVEIPTRINEEIVASGEHRPGAVSSRWNGPNRTEERSKPWQPKRNVMGEPADRAVLRTGGVQVPRRQNTSLKPSRCGFLRTDKEREGGGPTHVRGSDGRAE